LQVARVYEEERKSTTPVTDLEVLGNTCGQSFFFLLQTSLIKEKSIAGRY
jgi:hypothetical protein